MHIFHETRVSDMAGFIGSILSIDVSEARAVVAREKRTDLRGARVFATADLAADM